MSDQYNRTYAYLIKDIIDINMKDLSEILNENYTIVKTSDNFISVSNVDNLDELETKLGSYISSVIPNSEKPDCIVKMIHDNINLFFEITEDDNNVMIEKIDE